MNQLLPFSRYQVLLLFSKNTSQLVLTANVRPVLPIGDIAGSPSHTTRLAGLAEWKITGGSWFSVTPLGLAGLSLRASSTLSSGTLLGPSFGSAARIFSSSWLAALVSRLGKCEDSRRRL